MRSSRKEVDFVPRKRPLTGILKFRSDSFTTESCFWFLLLLFLFVWFVFNFLIYFFVFLFSFFRTWTLVFRVCPKFGLHTLKVSAGTPLGQRFLIWVLLVGHSLSSAVCSFHLEPLCSTQHKLQRHLAA